MPTVAFTGIPDNTETSRIIKFRESVMLGIVNIPRFQIGLDEITIAMRFRKPIIGGSIGITVKDFPKKLAQIAGARERLERELEEITRNLFPKSPIGSFKIEEGE